MPTVKAFDKLNAISINVVHSDGTETPLNPSRKDTTMPRTPVKPWPEPIVNLLASAGLVPGEKIPIATVDKALAKMDLTIKQRFRFKSELQHYGVIAP